MSETLEPKYKVKVPKLNAVKKKFDFSLSLPGMISAVGAGVLALTFFFVMGILIGRGYRPEADVPQLEQIMPGSEHGQLAEDRQPPQVLTSEELEYQDRLQAQPQQIMDDTGKPDQPEPQAIESDQSAKPEPAKPEPAKVETAQPAQAFTPTPAQPGEEVFDYIYQVASFRQMDMAEDLSKRIAASGLKTRIESADAKGSTWHRVQVLYHGTPASTDEMKAVLAKFGIDKPLLKKKTAAQ